MEYDIQCTLNTVGYYAVCSIQTALKSLMVHFGQSASALEARSVVKEFKALPLMVRESDLFLDRPFYSLLFCSLLFSSDKDDYADNDLY